MPQFSSLYGNRLDEELGSADSTVLFTTARRKSAINRGVLEFTRLTHCNVRFQSITVNSTASEYDVVGTDNDFLEYADVGSMFVYTSSGARQTLLYGDQFPRRDEPWLDAQIPGWRTSTVAAGVMQLPAYWYGGVSRRRYIGLYPAPSSGSSASMAVQIRYIAQPPVMTADTELPWTYNSSARIDLVPYHQASVHYGAHQLEKLRRDDQRSGQQYQLFLQYVTQWWQAQRRKGGDLVRFARNPFQIARRDRGSDLWRVQST